MTAVSKSSLIPMLSPARPWSAAIRERRSLDPGGRHAHQPGQRQRGGARRGQQRGQFGNGAAALLQLGPDVDLHEARHLPPGLVHRPGERGDQAGPIKRVDAVEQPHGFVGLVRLQLAHEMQRNVGPAVAQGGPLGLRLLHPVFTETALARRNQRGNRLGRVGLADRHEGDVGGCAPGQPGGLRNPVGDPGQQR